MSLKHALQTATYMDNIGDITQILKQVQAVLTDDHFVYTSGKHGSVYINKDRIYPHTDLVSSIGRMFANRFHEISPDVVVGPAIGGIILSQWTAYHLTKTSGREVLGVYTEKDESKNQVFTRGYDQLVAGKRIAIVEDLTTTGGSLAKVVVSAQAAGAEVVATGTMVNRNPAEVTAEKLGFPFESLMDLPVEAYDESDCPLCKSGVAINTSVGHGAKYLKSKQTI